MENKDTLEYIVSCIKETGKDPYSQIYGYLSTGNECYITRRGDARELIKSVDEAQLKHYVSKIDR